MIHDFNTNTDTDIDTDIGFNAHIRKCTRYYGGYHDRHRVIQWLWDVLKNEFTAEQRSSFLKVTSYYLIAFSFEFLSSL